MRALLLSAVAMGLASCGSDIGEAAAEGEASTAGAVNANSSDLPLGLEPFPGANITNNATFEEAGASMTIAAMETDAEANEIAEFFSAQAADQGFTFETVSELGENTPLMMNGTDGSGRNLTLTASPVGGKTSLRMMLSDNPE